MNGAAAGHPKNARVFCEGSQRCRDREVPRGAICRERPHITHVPKKASGTGTLCEPKTTHPKILNARSPGPSVQRVLAGAKAAKNCLSQRRRLYAGICRICEGTEKTLRAVPTSCRIGFSEKRPHEKRDDLSQTLQGRADISSRLFGSFASPCRLSLILHLEATECRCFAQTHERAILPEDMCRAVPYKPACTGGRSNSCPKGGAHQQHRNSQFRRRKERQRRCGARRRAEETGHGTP